MTFLPFVASLTTKGAPLSAFLAKLTPNGLYGVNIDENVILMSLTMPTMPWELIVLAQ